MHLMTQMCCVVFVPMYPSIARLDYERRSGHLCCQGYMHLSSCRFSRLNSARTDPLASDVLAVRRSILTPVSVATSLCLILPTVLQSFNLLRPETCTHFMEHVYEYASTSDTST